MKQTYGVEIENPTEVNTAIYRRLMWTALKQINFCVYTIFLYYAFIVIIDLYSTSL